MKNLNYKSIFLVILSFYVLFSAFCVTHAQANVSSIGIATYIPIINSKVEDGDIVVTTNKGYELSTVAYDPRIVGVVTVHPAISIRTDSKEKGFPVINTGTVLVKVNNQNGNIKKGDSITTSAMMGTGMKSVNTGFVLGEAISEAKFSKKGEVKLITVSINPHFVQFGSSVNNSLLDIFKLSKVAAYETPSKVLQYVVAGIIMIATFASGFIIFARSVNTGLEALGRNPLAGRMIQLGIIFNVAMIIVIIIAGTALAYFVIRL